MIISFDKRYRISSLPSAEVKIFPSQESNALADLLLFYFMGSVREKAGSASAESMCVDEMGCIGHDGIYFARRTDL
jgi:hypothetical protein